MSEAVQTILVALIALGAVAFIVRKVFSGARSDDRCSKCDGCAAAPAPRSSRGR